jgi:hypothetical protein
MKKICASLPVFLLACSFMMQSCYHYRISTTNNDPSTTYQQKTVHSFFWGLMQKRQNGIDVVAANCDSLKLNSIDEVRVTNNLGYSLITVATLGIWSPMTVQWKCPKPCRREGEIR